MARIHVLSFVDGVRQGERHPLLPANTTILGRSAEADLVLPDDSVSRKHVRFYEARGVTWLRDLGSRNGTRVNGQAVVHHRLRAGDRIGIGASLIRVESGDDSEVSRPRAEDSSGRSMSGSIQDIPLADVLQWLATSRKTGTLKVRGAQTGSLYLREGQVFGARIGGCENLHSEKALLRMLSWEDGVFELDSTVPADLGSDEIAPSLSSVLMEAARQTDELAHLASKNGLPSDVVMLGRSKKPWSELTPEQLNLLQVVSEGQNWQEILDSSRRSDLDLSKDIVALHKVGAVEYE